MTHRRFARLAAGVALIVSLGSTVMLSEQPTASGAPKAGDKSFATPKTPPPGPYGSNTFYSSPEEEERLAQLAGEVALYSAVGYGRTSEYSFLVRLSRDSEARSSYHVAGFAVDFKLSQFTTKSLESTWVEINESLAQENASENLVGIAYDPMSDTIEVEGLISARFARTWSDDARLTLMESTPAMRTASRFNDTEPFFGGAAIYPRKNSTTDQGRCSSGFSVRGTSGTEFMITAGHCYDLGDRVWSKATDTTLGTVTRRPSFPYRDMELISGEDMYGALWMGGSTGVGYGVSSGREADIGDVVCTSGTTTFQQCGKTIVAKNGQLCDASGCTNYLMRMSGGARVQGGDSGGPIVNLGPSSVGVRGIVIGVVGSNDYGQRWASIVDEFPGLVAIQQ